MYKIVVYMYTICTFVYINNNNTMKEGLDLKSKCAESLKTMSVCLTVRDKKDAAKKLRVHYNTILNYLRGDIGDVDMGLQLVAFFNVRIGERINKVHQILATV